MDYRKKNWTGILNNWIASIALILTTLLLGLCFVTPTINASANVSQSDINEYNIHFVASKTKVRSASGLNKVLLSERPTGGVTPEFYTYQYRYNSHSDTQLYYGTSGEIFSSTFTSTTQSNDILFSAFDSNVSYDRSNGYIPYGINYFGNVDGQKEEIFYDSANEGDFVVINNYNNLSATDNFNVENFYLSFGSPYIDEYTSTPLSSLRVEGKLYSENTTHLLALNEVELSAVKDEDENTHNAYYWNQYFDLRSLKAYITNEVGSETYDIENQQGKYQITFYFIRYDSNMSPVSTSEESFTFTFYLLDGNEYSVYPTIKNTHSTKAESNTINQYFYNFTSDSPYISYDPTKYNIAYDRTNNTASESITSNFTSKTYSLGEGRAYPLGIITYRNSSRVVKEVYILTYYNDDMSMVEYLYLSTTNPSSSHAVPSNYDGFISAIENNSIDFEYKTTVIREFDNSSTYTTNTYKTTTFENYQFLTDITPTIADVSSKVDALIGSYIINATDNNYTLNGSELATIGEATNNAYPVTAIGSNINLKQLQYLLDIAKIDLEYSYELVVEDLGIYNISYAYVCPAINDSGVQKYYINSTSQDTANNYYSSSTNFTTPVDYATAVASETTVTRTYDDNSDLALNYVVSGYLGEEVARQVKLNGITFQFNQTKNTLTINSTAYTLNDNLEFDNPITLTPFTSGDGSVPQLETNVKIEDINGRYRLSVIFSIGTQDSQITTITKTNATGYRSYIDTITTTKYELKSDLSSDTSVPENNAEWQELRKIILTIRSYEPVTGSANTYSHTVVDSSMQESTQGEDKLHIFGSIAYFNKSDSYTDSGYAKLKQVDSQLNLNYLSDITKYRTNLVSNATTASYFMGKIASGLNKNNIIITDVTPVLWNNFSTLSYNSKKSNSYIYRYTDYSFDEDGNIVYDSSTAQISSYQKDIYCQFDGLYEIVIAYNYNYLEGIFYQLFTFIIDNSSPALNIEVKNDEGEFESFGLNKYTNRDVRLSWEVPTYFKNDVYVEINKSYYNASDTTYNFISYYQQNTITTTSGNSTYVNKISQMGTYFKEVNGVNREYYYVDLAVQSGADANYNLNGNYKIIVHYNASGRSTFTEEFIIDKQDISGLNIQPVVKDADGGYSINKGITFDSSQIVNSDFTFRFSPKDSGASIFVYYDKIDLESTDDYDKIVNVDSLSGTYGITTKFNVNGDKISTGTPYVYEYTHLDSPSHVESNNLLTSNNSSLFLFRMQDEAGNECRYVVFYDTTEPRFLTSPEPDSVTHIINDTTRVVWGDYKAIKVTSSTPIEIDDINKSVTNYSKEDTSKLDIILRYMNTNSYFNNLKVQLIDDDYYILVPVTETKIQDYEYDNKLNLSSDIKEYYFFPVNPIETEGNTNYITLPTYNSDGSIQMSDGNIVKTRYEVANYSTTSVLDFYGDAVVRYITLTYYTDATKNKEITISGAVGEGTYIYSVLDDLGNKTSGLLWMNLDKTQTLAYGLFDYSDNLKNAQALSIDETTYSASKLFISSLNSTVDGSIPEYEVTYMHYAYDTSLYTDYNVSSIKLLNSSNTDSITNANETYLQLIMNHKTEAVTKTINVPLTDEDGNKIPSYSYPYSLEGSAIVADTSGNAKDVYSAGYSYLNNDETRKYSLALNITTDTNRQKVVTEEGLYIFKRTYTDPDIDETKLGTDSRIRYLVYYVDRSGIINISTSNSVASKLYDVGSAIGFTLGSNYTDTTQQKYINAETIQNNQTTASSTNNSNSSYQSLDLFATNKIQVEFTMAYDKHNFEDFVANNKSSYEAIINASELSTTDKSTLKEMLNNTLFNEWKFSSNVYKVDLKLNVGSISTTGTTIINEREDYYSTLAMSAYLKGTPMINSNTRSNYFDFYYDTGKNYYVINISDQAGYVKYNADNTIADDNYLANNLAITFDITHDAPEGELYGKYYGRHDYDNNSTNDANSSIPTDSDGRYAILSKYLQEGQLEPLSDSDQEVIHSTSGDYIKLKSTNNETMIFTFSITEDEYQAKIDPNNIKIYKGGMSDANLIFNRVDGVNIATTLVTATRQKNSFVMNEINGITYYAIIIFDNNLDDILDADEKLLYSNFRLLDKVDNIDSETYYIQINYVGNASDYVGEDDLGNPLSFYNTTYEIIVDRIKPMYNLTKLMSLDKYVYNTIDTTVTTTNYEDVFKSYQSVYNFTYEEEQDFYRSDLENYFFALDCREDTSFKFESVSNLDNNKGIYIRPVSKSDYKFSVTPDDYRAYYNAVYLQGHPQFTPSSAIAISAETYSPSQELTLNKYYYLPFSFDSNGDGSSISASFLKEQGIFRSNSYYEIIESDETGNYRVYAIYIPEQTSNLIEYTYQLNNNVSSEQTITFRDGNSPTQDSRGMELTFTKIKLKDNYLRANLEIVTNTFTHNIDIIFNPNDLSITVTNRTTKSIMWQFTADSRDKDNYTNTDSFIEAINYTLDYYYQLINDKSHSYYSQYGYEVDIDIVDRIGVSVKNEKILYNYEIDYVVAGSTLSPIFIDHNSNFTMRLEGQKGSTYLTDIRVYKFNKSWLQINVDNSSTPKIFDLTEEELKSPIDYLFTRGVYKFVFVDNFNRTNEFYHEFGISSSQTGGSLSFSDSKITLTDGYTYSASPIEYTFDSSVYNVFIKFIGKMPDEFAEGEYITIDDSQNYVIYNSSNTYTADYLKTYFGISIITSGNTTTISFAGVKDNSTLSGTTDLTKYHIKAILASTSDNYTWNAENNNSGDDESNTDIIVYDKQIAIYTAIQDINIRNLSGNTLDTSEHLNLTEDFELVTTWKSNVALSERFTLNSRIILTRTYNDNGTIRSTTSSVESGKIISQPGDYTAYVVNDLGMTSRTISFTRGEGEISMYAVYAINSSNSSEKKLSPSSLITSDNDENKVLFTYFITDDYFSYKDALDGTIITSDNLDNYRSDPEVANKIAVNLSATKYIDVRVNSNLSIKTEIYSVEFDNSGYPYIQYRIYSDTKTGERYTYRFIRIIFVSSQDTDFSDVNVCDPDENNINLAEKNSLITSTSDSIRVQFAFFNNDYADGSLLVPLGDTIYIDRYYNGVLAETTVLSMSDETNIPTFTMNINTVGLHEFVIRDLAGRVHSFNGSDRLKIYLINQILFTVNDENPINNQIFNGNVDVDVVFSLSGLQLYNTRSLSIKVIKNGVETNTDGSSGSFTLTTAGYYTITMSAVTLINENSSIQISSTYNCLIVDTEIANRTFSISKGTGFTIEKLVKIVGNDKQDLTNNYEQSIKDSVNSDVLLWLTASEHNNSIFDVTLKYYESISNIYRTFNFRVWINDETPIILSSIAEGTSTKDTIEINYNPGLIYTQIGKGYITLNDQVIAEINSDSLSYVDTLTIDKKGTYWFKIFSEDGTLISSYKFTKNEPVNSMTKFILIGVAIAIVVVVILFFLLRRKGKYR